MPYNKGEDVEDSLCARQPANHGVVVNSVNPEDSDEVVWLEEETEDTIPRQEVADVSCVAFHANDLQCSLHHGYWFGNMRVEEKIHRHSC